MTCCDICAETLHGDGVLKQPCGHRLHKKCDLDDTQCAACAQSQKFSSDMFYVFLLLAAAILGAVAGHFVYEEDSVHQSVRHIEANLRKMEQLSSQSFSARKPVRECLARISVAVEQELMGVMRK